MAWFSYKCPDHGLFKVNLVKRQSSHPCTAPMGCDELECKPVLRAGSIQVVERLDNGAMARRVERLHNIEEIMDERDKKSSERVMGEIEALDEED